MLNVNPFPGPFGLTPSNPFTNPFELNRGIARLPQEQPRELSLPRFVNYAADFSGCGFWRILWPELLINQSGLGISSTNTGMVTDPRWYTGVKTVRLQRQASNEQREFVRYLKSIQKDYGFKLIYEVDDVVFREEIPNYNKFKFAFDDEQTRNNCVEIIKMCDEVTVTCDFMRRLYQEKTGKSEITVIPNFVPYFWMGHIYNKNKVYDTFEKNKKRPRVLYTGSGAHYDVDNKNNGIDDFSHVINTVIKTLDKYQWVFVGSYPPPLHPYVQSKKIEFHPWQNLTNYPVFINNLNPQVTIAPLLDNNFNRSKSDIKFIESCVLGLPCIVQDMETYKNAPEFLKFKTGEDLEERLDQILKNKSQYYKNVELFRHIGSQRFLEHRENIGCHVEALTTPFNSPDRKLLKRWN